MSISAVLAASTFKSAAFAITATLRRRSILSLPSRTDCATSRRPPPILAAHNTTRIAMPAQFDRPPRDHRSGLSALRASAFGLIAAALLAVLPAGPARSQSDPVIAKVNGVEIHESDLAMAEEDVGQNQQVQTLSRRRQARLPGVLSRRRDPGGQGGRGQEGRRPEGVQEPPRLHPQQAADGDAAAAGGQGGADRRGDEEGL